MARHDDAIVGRNQILLGPVNDRAHAFLERRILHADPMDAAEGVATLLSGPVHEIVVVLVGERPERSRQVSHVDAMSLPHRVALRGGERPGYLVVEAPCPAVFVVDWHPEVS